MRAILDANVLVSAVLSKTGAPARLVELWLAGAFELLVSEALLSEVERALEYPKVRERIEPADASELVRLVREIAHVIPDPEAPPPVRSPDERDDYLVALAAAEDVRLVTGDAHLLGLGDRLPILTPRAFLDQLEA